MMGVGGGASPLEGVAPIVSKALPTAKEAIGKGLARAGEVAFAPFKSTSEAAINAAEQGAGVVLRSPVTKQMAQELGLQKGAQSFAEVSNSIKSTLDSGGRIPLQVAKDFLNKADTVFKTAMGKAEKAALSQSVAAVRNFLNKEIPARSMPAAKLANAYLRSNIAKGATGGALIEGIRRLYKWGKR
jgi:molybdopterin-binding protein